LPYYHGTPPGTSSFPRRPTHPAIRHAGRTAVTTQPGHRPPAPAPAAVAGLGPAPGFRSGSRLPIRLPAPARLLASDPAPGFRSGSWLWPGSWLPVRPPAPVGVGTGPGGRPEP